MAAAGGLQAAAAAAEAPLDINTATAAQLDALPGIGPALAKRIVEYRQEHGPFSSVDDLAKVSGVGPSVIGQIRDRVTLGGGAPAAVAPPAAATADPPQVAAEPPPAASGEAREGEDRPAPAREGTAAGRRIDLNTATAKDLERLPGLGATNARRIVEYRETNGPFKTVWQLREILSERIVRDLVEKDLLFVTGETPPRAAADGRREAAEEADARGIPRWAWILLGAGVVMCASLFFARRALLSALERLSSLLGIRARLLAVSLLVSTLAALTVWTALDRLLLRDAEARFRGRCDAVGRSALIAWAEAQRTPLYFSPGSPSVTDLAQEAGGQVDSGEATDAARAPEEEVVPVGEAEPEATSEETHARVGENQGNYSFARLLRNYRPIGAEALFLDRRGAEAVWRFSPAIPPAHREALKTQLSFSVRTTSHYS